MMMLNPKLAIDETDSGIRHWCVENRCGWCESIQNEGNAVLLITHYQRLLNYIQPDFVHVLADGKIIKTGDKSLALELEEKRLRLAFKLIRLSFNLLIDTKSNHYNGFIWTNYQYTFIFLWNLRHSFLDEDRKTTLQNFELKGFRPKRWGIQIHQSEKKSRKKYNFSDRRTNISKEQLDVLHLGEENFDRIVFINGKLHKEFSKISINNAEFLSFGYALNDSNHKKLSTNISTRLQTEIWLSQL